MTTTVSSDGREVLRTHTSPRRRDSDRDGLTDGLELGVTRLRRLLARPSSVARARGGSAPTPIRARTRARAAATATATG